MADTERIGDLVRDRAVGVARDLLQVDKETTGREESEGRWFDGGGGDGRCKEGWEQQSHS